MIYIFHGVFPDLVKYVNAKALEAQGIYFFEMKKKSQGMKEIAILVIGFKLLPFVYSLLEDKKTHVIFPVVCL